MQLGETLRPVPEAGVAHNIVMKRRAKSYEKRTDVTYSTAGNPRQSYIVKCYAILQEYKATFVDNASRQTYFIPHISTDPRII